MELQDVSMRDVKGDLCSIKYSEKVLSLEEGIGVQAHGIAMNDRNRH